MAVMSRLSLHITCVIDWVTKRIRIVFLTNQISYGQLLIEKLWKDMIVMKKREKS